MIRSASAESYGSYIISFFDCFSVFESGQFYIPLGSVCTFQCESLLTFGVVIIFILAILIDIE